MRRYIPHALGLAAIMFSTAATASETISYKYDARGRLKQVSRSGTVNNGITTTYTYDKAHNRLTKVSNSPNPGPP